MVKKLISLVCIITAIVLFLTMETDQKDQVSDLQLENIDALAIPAENETGSGGYYKIIQRQCPAPKDYKKEQICERGGKEDCMPSDC